MGIFSIRNNYLRSTYDPNYRQNFVTGLSINTVQYNEKTLFWLSMGIFFIRNNYLRSTCDPNNRHGVPIGVTKHRSIYKNALFRLSIGIFSIRNNYLNSSCDPNY